MRPLNRLRKDHQRTPRPEVDLKRMRIGNKQEHTKFLDGLTRAQRAARARMQALGILHPQDFSTAMVLLGYKMGRLNLQQVRKSQQQMPIWQRVAAVLALGAAIEGCEFAPWEAKEPGHNNGQMADQLPPPDLAVPLNGPDAGMQPDQNGDMNGDAKGDANGDGPIDGTDDIPVIQMPDIAMQDSATPPDKAVEEPDLATPPDQAKSDLAVPPQDLTMTPVDKAIPPDLAKPPDLTLPPDLAIPTDLTIIDLRPPHDLTTPADLTTPTDLTKVDLCGLITTNCEHIGVCGGNPTCVSGIDMKQALMCKCTINCIPDGSTMKCICSTPVNERCVADNP